jgi:DNA/RNA endonuclease YhcR with UshA esterase domain
MLNVLLLAATLQTPAPESIAAKDAKNFVGKEKTVCGLVAATRYLETSASRPTFLNFDKPNPNQTFTVVIFGDDRTKFGEPEVTYRNKTICVTGKIEDYRGSPQIVAKDPKQITETK